MSSASSSSRSPSPEPIELPAQLSELCQLTESKPESLVHGDTDIQAAALRATKFLFDRGVLSEAGAAPAMDELLKSIDVPQAPVTRSQTAKQRAGTAPPPKEPIRFGRTPLTSLVLDGMGADQIWAQLELRAKNVCAILDSIIDREPDDDEAEEGAGGEDMDVDQGVGPSGSNGLTGPLGVDDEEEEEEESSDEEDLGEDIVKLRDHLEEEEEQLVVGSQRPRRRPQQQPIWKGPRHPTLDDGFFGIDKFNRDTELMEAKSRSRGRLGGDEDDSEEEEEDIDLFAPIDAGEDEEMEVDDDEEEDEEDEESDEEEGGIPGKQSMLNGAFKTEGMDGVMYDDFFRPPFKFADSAPSQAPARPAPAPSPPKAKGKGKAKASVRFHDEVRVKKIKARGKGKSLDDDDDDEEDDYDALGTGVNGAGGAFMNPFMGMTGPGGFGGFAPRQVGMTGPGGFGGFAPRQPVVAPPEGEGNQNGPSLNGADPFAGIDDMDREDSDEDYEEEDHEDGMDDDDDEEGDEEDEDEDDEEEDEEDDYEMDDGQEAIERLKNDIFAEPEEGYRAPEELSTHEKRLRAIAQEISILEDQNVSEKHWTQMGEANAKRRPENSLLETDLEFEASAKPAPIITEEVTQSLEDMIKGRILENRFDDVIRQRPVDDKAFLPSKVLEISDKEGQKSLAEIYEDEYTAAASGEGRKDDRLAQEHKEIEKTWGDICYKLDALCNAHFTPKQPKATINTLSNVASASLESALPSSVATSTILAPEEMFAFDPRATTSKTEMSPAEKKALRTKVKHERKSQGQLINGAVVKFSNNAGGSATAAAGLKNGKQPRNVKEARDAALESLVKTGKGVTVVGKPHVGQSTSVKDKAREGGASLKL